MIWKNPIDFCLYVNWYTCIVLVFTLYSWLMIWFSRDFDAYDLRMRLPAVVAKLYKAVNRNGGVTYVHCTAGLGRAPSVAVCTPNFFLFFMLQINFYSGNGFMILISVFSRKLPPTLCFVDLVLWTAPSFFSVNHVHYCVKNVITRLFIFFLYFIWFFLLPNKPFISVFFFSPREELRNLTQATHLIATWMITCMILFKKKRRAKRGKKYHIYEGHRYVNSSFPFCPI